MKESGQEISFSKREANLSNIESVPLNSVEFALEMIGRQKLTYEGLAAAATNPTDAVKFANTALDLDTLARQLAEYLPPVDTGEFDALLDAA